MCVCTGEDNEGGEEEANVLSDEDSGNETATISSEDD